MTDSSSKSLALKIVHWALQKKAEDVVVMDLTGIFDVTDHFVLLTGLSEIQVEAIVDVILDGAAAERLGPLHVERGSHARWVLIDFVDVVVHVMLPEERLKYSLERLWGDAPLTRYSDRGEAIDASVATEREDRP